MTVGGARPARRTRVSCSPMVFPVSAVAVLTVAYLVVLRVHPGGPLAGRAVDDLGQLLTAAAAAAAAGWRARRSTPRAARAWALLSAGTGCWALGEGVWSYYELFAARQTPFPSVADAGFLLFPVLAATGLLRWPSAAVHGGRRWRTLLDGILVAGSLFVISWVTALGSVARSGGSRFGYVVSLAYPVCDLVLLTLTVIVIAHAGVGSGLGLVAVGLAALCVADSGFAYLTAIGRYATGSPVDAGWFGGFLLIAAAARSATQPHEQVPAASARESTTSSVLPYVPAGAGLAVAAAAELLGRGQRVSFAAAVIVVVALLIRQLLAVLDNHRLVAQLEQAQLELHHQAFHDPLTGLANRALFHDRLHHGLQLHRRDLRPLGLIYLDLDGFKTVNDTLGHDAGDHVLLVAAERLRAVTRPGDTVARLGGDEFAVLVEDGGDATTVAARILDAFTQPAAVGRHIIPLAGSLGVAELTPDAPPVTPADFLRRADTAMYQAKHTGKGTAVTWTDHLTSHHPAGAHPT